MRPYLEKNPSQKRAGGVALGVGPQFKSQHHKKIEGEKGKWRNKRLRKLVFEQNGMGG
jgi:hypothetical protein